VVEKEPEGADRIADPEMGENEIGKDEVEVNGISVVPARAISFLRNDFCIFLHLLLCYITKMLI